MRRHTLVVGGTRGIGRAVVKKLAEEQHVVSVIGRRAVSKPDPSDPQVRYWLTDLADQEGVTRVLADIFDQIGKLNHLVFCQRYRGDEDTWTGETSTSLTATKNVIDRSVDHFDATDGSSIVIIGSIASHFIATEQPLSYHVAKAGLNQLVRYYALTLGPKGIRVNCVSPATVLKEESRSFYAENEALYNLYNTISPLGRMATAEDVADVVSLLCSQRASMITGQNIVVDGGLSLQSHEALARKLTSLTHLKITRQAGGGRDA